MLRPPASVSTASWFASRDPDQPWVLLESTNPAAQNRRTLRFSRAVDEIVLAVGDSPDAFLDALDDALARGLWAAGYVTYEAGLLFEPRLRALAAKATAQPLAWFGLYPAPEILCDAPRDRATAHVDPLCPGDPPHVKVHAGTMSRTRYREHFAHIHECIVRGETYQVNFTFPLSVRTDLAPRDLYLALRRRQRVSWGACLYDGTRHILSLSPELFLARDGDRIWSRPMKGTAPREVARTRDTAARRWLQTDPKNRAENVMIVDMIRNDLGRVARTGTVVTPDLFEVETYETLHQMVSTVRARLRPDATWRDIFLATFPCASVTGAPKIRTMEIISKLESHPRGVYTGAIGYIAPNGDARWNVAIRTLEFDGSNSARMGVGSGIVSDSNADAEYDECLLKAQFLTGDAVARPQTQSPPDREPNVPRGESEVHTVRAPRFAAGDGRPSPPGRRPGREYCDALDGNRPSIEWLHVPDDLEIVETLLWDNGSFVRIRDHLARMAASASTLGFPFDRGKTERILTGAVGRATKTRRRVRVLLARDGQVRVTHQPVSPGQDRPMRFAIWPEAVTSDTPWLYHKTTYRPLYERVRMELARYRVDEFVFTNERDEITEGTITSVFVEIDGQLYTPPIGCGLLPGTLRAHLLTRDRCRERVITRENLAQASRVLLGNSIRGIVEAVISTPPATMPPDR